MFSWVGFPMNYNKVFVTGAAGFIGSNLVDRLLADGKQVVGYDNLSTGFEEFLLSANKNPNFLFIKGDTLDQNSLQESMSGCDFVFHLAANADVRFGTEHPQKDLEQNTVATFNVLEAMRYNQIKTIAFSSTGSIYGETKQIPTPEDCPFPIQTSLYGASKLSGEALISSYAEGFGFKGWIFRFVSVLGERYTHGHVFDFYKKLLQDPKKLHILGNGKQKKSYIYVQDCINGMFRAIEKSDDKVNVFNLGFDGYVEVNDSVDVITKHLGINPKRTYEGGERGWVGDNPFIFLDTSKVSSIGWKPLLTIEDSIVKTLDWIKENEWIYKRKS